MKILLMNYLAQRPYEIGKLNYLHFIDMQTETLRD
jgi:hypothetical protein